jgi:hypothetical protein
MNERIRELATQAGMILDIGDTSEFDMAKFMPKELKFAELIVLECAVIVGSMEEPHQDIAKLIKQHFGVEE